jgi:hypothetical protein
LPVRTRVIVSEFVEIVAWWLQGAQWASFLEHSAHNAVHRHQVGLAESISLNYFWSWWLRRWWSFDAHHGRSLVQESVSYFILSKEEKESKTLSEKCKTIV